MLMWLATLMSPPSPIHQSGPPSVPIPAPSYSAVSSSLSQKTQCESIHSVITLSSASASPSDIVSVQSFSSMPEKSNAGFSSAAPSFTSTSKDSILFSSSILSGVKNYSRHKYSALF